MKRPIIILTLITLFSISCSDFLDETPYSIVEANNMYTTYEEADMAVMGIYSVFNGSGGMNSRWQSLLEYGTDEARNYFNNAKINDQFYKISNYTQTSSDVNITDLWTGIYSGIGKANDVYHKVEQMNLSPQKKRILQAEALFMRSYLYFNLVQLWGGVRINTELPDYETVATRYASRASVQEVYAQIVKDMEFAKQYLPNFQKEEHAGRVTKYAAYGLAAKIYLTMASGSRFGVAGYEFFDPEAYYQLAKANADTVITKSENRFGLLDQYADVFPINNKHNREVLFEASFNTGGPGSQYSKMGGPVGNGSYYYADYGYTGRGYLRPTVYLSLGIYGVSVTFSGTGTISTVTSDDVRFGYNVSTNDISNAGVNVHKANPENWYAYKFSLRQAEMPGFTWTTVPMNHPILRYADVLLIYAEAAGMLNLNDPSAYNAINKVRQRAKRQGTNPIYLKDLEPGDFTDIDTFMDAILDERMRELCFEGHRRFDLLRTSGLFRAIQRMKATDERLSNLLNDPTTTTTQRAVNSDYEQTRYGVNLKPYHVLFPIPQYEMNIISNPEYLQNPGYAN